MFGDERKGGIGCRDLCIQEQWLLTDIVALNLSDDFLSVGIIVMDLYWDLHMAAVVFYAANDPLD